MEFSNLLQLPFAFFFLWGHRFKIHAGDVKISSFKGSTHTIDDTSIVKEFEVFSLLVRIIKIKLKVMVIES